jgi:hypothetical protein
MTFAAPVQGSAIQPVESWSKFSFCLDIDQWRPRKVPWLPAADHARRHALGIEPDAAPG